MTHSVTTADRYYSLISRRDNALNMTNMITKVMSPTVDSAIRKDVKIVHKRRAFNEAEAASILQMCSSFIDDNTKPISYQSVVECLTASDDGVKLMDDFATKFGAKKYLKKVVDKVRCEVRKRTKKGQYEK